MNSWDNACVRLRMNGRIKSIKRFSFFLRYQKGFFAHANCRSNWTSRSGHKRSLGPSEYVRTKTIDCKCKCILTCSPSETQKHWIDVREGLRHFLKPRPTAEHVPALTPFPPAQNSTRSHHTLTSPQETWHDTHTHTLTHTHTHTQTHTHTYIHTHTHTLT